MVDVIPPNPNVIYVHVKTCLRKVSTKSPSDQQQQPWWRVFISFSFLESWGNFLCHFSSKCFIYAPPRLRLHLRSNPDLRYRCWRRAEFLHHPAFFFFFFELHVVDTITVESSGSLAKQQLHILSNASKSDLFLRQRALKPELSQTDQIL